MLSAFVDGGHFPIPDMLICSVGAVCDDFSAIAQRVEQLGHPILWWELPARRAPQHDEQVRDELSRIAAALEKQTGQTLDDDRLRGGIERANATRRVLAELRRLA